MSIRAQEIDDSGLGKAKPSARFADAEWSKQRDNYLPSRSDGDFINSLMQPQMEAGKYASWIAPPRVGIDNKPGDFEYVKIENA